MCSWLLLFLLLLTGCQAGFPAGTSIRVRIGATAFHTLASAKTEADVDHFTLQLRRLADQCLITVYRTAYNGETAFWLNHVPDGRYGLTAEAFESVDDSVSITQGGPQASLNSVTVANGQTTYSDNSSALAVALKLLDGTSGKAMLGLLVVPGLTWTGDPVGMP